MEQMFKVQKGKFYNFNGREEEWYFIVTDKGIVPGLRFLKEEHAQEHCDLMNKEGRVIGYKELKDKYYESVNSRILEMRNDAFNDVDKLKRAIKSKFG